MLQGCLLKHFHRVYFPVHKYPLRMFGDSRIGMILESALLASGSRGSARTQDYFPVVDDFAQGGMFIPLTPLAKVQLPLDLGSIVLGQRLQQRTGPHRL